MSRLTQILRGKKITPLTELEGAVAAAMNATGGELPAVTTDDNGDVLTVANGKWTPVTPTAELPAYTATENGKVLGVVDGALAWVSKT